MTSSTHSRHEILRTFFLLFFLMLGTCSEDTPLPVCFQFLLLLPFVRCCSLPSAEVQSVVFFFFVFQLQSCRLARFQETNGKKKQTRIYAQPTPRPIRRDRRSRRRYSTFLSKGKKKKKVCLVCVFFCFVCVVFFFCFLLI